MGSALNNSNIHLVLVSAPVYGHVRPHRVLARELAQRGYGVTFITGNAYASSPRRIKGVEFVPLKGKAAYDPDRILDYFPERARVSKESEIMGWDAAHIFLGCMKEQHEVLQEVLSDPKLAGKNLIIIGDLVFSGTLPMAMGSPMTKRVPYIGTSHAPLLCTSKEVPPMGTGLPSQGVEHNLTLHEFAVMIMNSFAVALDD